MDLQIRLSWNLGDEKTLVESIRRIRLFTNVYNYFSIFNNVIMNNC